MARLGSKHLFLLNPLAARVFLFFLGGWGVFFLFCFVFLRIKTNSYKNQNVYINQEVNSDSTVTCRIDSHFVTTYCNILL